MFEVLTLDLVCPGAFLFLDLLFISVINVNDTICARCRSERAGNLIAVVRSDSRCKGFLPYFEMSDGAGSEIVGGACVLIGLCGTID